MAGYNWREGKSNNYIDAEDRGLLKGSEAVKYLKKHYKITITAKELEKKDIHTEWHHASKFFNVVYFYSTETLDRWGKKHEGKNFNLDMKEEQVTALFVEWEISYGRYGKKQYSKKEVVYSGIKKGNWLHLEDGSKKSLTGKGFVRFI